MEPVQGPKLKWRSVLHYTHFMSRSSTSRIEGKTHVITKLEHERVSRYRLGRRASIVIGQYWTSHNINTKSSYLPQGQTALLPSKVSPSGGHGGAAATAEATRAATMSEIAAVKHITMINYIQKNEKVSQVGIG